MATKTKSSAIDLSSPEGETFLKEYAPSYPGEDLPGQLEEYLKTGRFEFSHGKGVGIVTQHQEYVYAVKGGGVYYVNNRLELVDTRRSSLKATVKKSFSSMPEAVLIPWTNRTIANKQYKLFMVMNGDEDNNNLVNDFSGAFPTFSFTCLARFYLRNPKASITEAMYKTITNKLAKGSIRLVDYIEDDSQDLTIQELGLLKAGKPFPAPAPGYSLIRAGWAKGGHQWHRPATVLLHDRDLNKTYLMGTDESTYFGVELMDNPADIAAAYISLLPPELRKVNATSYKRQGEWFLVPVKDEAVPDFPDCIAMFEELDLPVDDKDSNRHKIDAFDGRISKDGKIFALNATLEHSAQEHSNVTVTGWCTFYKNTAVRSFSIEGVD